MTKKRAPTAEPIVAERMPNGQFAVGHQYCGRSELMALQLEKRRHILRATTPEEAMEVMKSLHLQALLGGKGAPAAAAVWLSYAVGRPETIMDPKDAQTTFDVQNLNKPAAELTPEQRRQRLQLLLAQQAAEKEKR